MCGIAAIFNYRTGEPIDRAELTTIRDAMAARGPDGSGNWFTPDGRLGLDHRRLAIIDLSPTGAQPMLKHDASLAIIFNGEIYNLPQPRSEPESKGFLIPARPRVEWRVFRKKLGVEWSHLSGPKGNGRR